MFRILAVVIIAALSAAITTALIKTEQAPRETSVYERVMASSTIRCGYTLYSVGLNKDAAGNLYGIYKDMMDHIGALLSLDIEWVEQVGWGEQIQGLNNNRYDLVCSPANMTGPRVRHADVSQPLYYSPVYAWVRTDDDRFGDGEKGLPRANAVDIRIATIDGEQAEDQAKRFFPQAELFSAPQSSTFDTMFLNVTTGKADVAIAEPAAVYAFLEHNKSAALVPLRSDDPLILAVNIILMKTHEPAFKALINNAITTLNANGVLTEIINRWEPYSGSYIRVSRTQ